MRNSIFWAIRFGHGRADSAMGNGAALSASVLAPILDSTRPAFAPPRAPPLNFATEPDYVLADKICP
jgi:hypothetical protein